MAGRVWAAGAAALLLGGAVQAQPTEGRPALFRELVDCRALTDPAARLACYDKAAAALDSAEKSKDLVVVDRDQVRKARRSLFGFTLPSLKIFGGGDDARVEKEEEEFTEIETTIKSAGRNGAGRWVVTLEDGARWTQIDSRDLPRDPRAGQKIRIRKASMGSYFANVDGQIAIRMRRES